MDKDLTNLKGIGTTAAASLSEAGFKTIDEVAKATVESLAKVHGFGPSRAAKVIESAKELSKTTDSEAKSEPKVAVKPVDSTPESKAEEKVAAKPVVDLDKLAYSKTAKKEEKGGGFIGFITGTWAVIIFIVVLLLIGFAINSPDTFEDLYTDVKSKSSDVFTQNDTSDTGNTTETANNTVTADNVDTGNNSVTDGAESNLTADTGSANNQTGDSTDTNQTHSEVPKWFADQVRAGVKQPVEPEWVKQQRLESEKRRAEFESYNADMQKRIASGKQPIAPPWIAQQQADAKKYQAEMQKRFANGKPPVAPPWVAQQRAEIDKRNARRLPPITPDWIKQRRAEAEKYRARMQKRPLNAPPPNAPAWVKKQHAEALKRIEQAKRQRDAYWAARGYPVRPSN